MNYLAHIFLAGKEPEAQLGGLLGDFTKPGGSLAFSRTIEREIQLHRFIDSFTDTHEVVLAAKSRFRPGTRRFSGIVLDVLYDHFLASAWSEYTDEDIKRFTSRFYFYLLQAPASLPERLSRIVPSLVNEDWLGSYVAYAGFERAIHRLSSRVTRGAEDLVSGLEDAANNRADFENGFKSFFPELQSYVKSKRRELNGVEV